MLRTTLPIRSLLLPTQICLLHPKNTSRRPLRTQHSVMHWKKHQPHHLTAKTLEETPHRPSFPDFQEEVDRPHFVPGGSAKCYQCAKTIDTEVQDTTDFIWIPSGNRKSPYFFHRRCFHCAKCGFRFMNNQFYTLDGRAVCVPCGLGRQPVFPTRWWHGNANAVSRGRLSSRMAGHSFPRHQHQIEFLYDPES